MYTESAFEPNFLEANVFSLHGCLVYLYIYYLFLGSYGYAYKHTLGIAIATGFDFGAYVLSV